MKATPLSWTAVPGSLISTPSVASVDTSERVTTGPSLTLPSSHVTYLRINPACDQQGRQPHHRASAPHRRPNSSSLHPNYAQELVRLFKDPLTNPHQSQLIFTTHDVPSSPARAPNCASSTRTRSGSSRKHAGSLGHIPVTTIQQSRCDESFVSNYIHGAYEASPMPHFHEAFAQVASDLNDAVTYPSKTDANGNR